MVGFREREREERVGYRWREWRGIGYREKDVYIAEEMEENRSFYG